MARVVQAANLPQLRSTRDTRARIDLVTEETFGLTELRADRITYHPGDTAAAHLHRDAKHFFFVLQGRGVLHADGEAVELAAGDVALVTDRWGSLPAVLGERRAGDLRRLHLAWRHLGRLPRGQLAL